MTGPVIKLEGGPGHGQIYFESDFRDRIKAAQRMGRTEATGPGWALGYAPGPATCGYGRAESTATPPSPVIPDLTPYGAAFHAELASEGNAPCG
jgi:hypothetical protein